MCARSWPRCEARDDQVGEGNSRPEEFERAPRRHRFIECDGMHKAERMPPDAAQRGGKYDGRIDQIAENGNITCVHVPLWSCTDSRNAVSLSD